MGTLEDVKVGDKVILSSRYNDEIIEVTRLTKTQIVCGASKFNRTTGRMVGCDGWSSSSIKIATEADIKRVEREKRRRKMIAHITRYTGYQYLSDEKLEQIYNILKGEQNNE